MIKKPLELFSLKRRPRKLRDDESLCWDKVCPKCGFQSLIFMWNWQEKKYAESRCISPDCKFGNV